MPLSIYTYPCDKPPIAIHDHAQTWMAWFLTCGHREISLHCQEEEIPLQAGVVAAGLQYGINLQEC